MNKGKKETVEMDEPLSRAQVRRLLRVIVEEGEVTFSKHALEQMKARELTVDDCLAVLRGGWCEFEEEVNGTWRYRVTTHKICVVVAFRSEDATRVVTVWRLD